MENEEYAPSFGQNEELEFDIHEYDGKRRAINITGPGGAPLKGFIFTANQNQEAKNWVSQKSFDPLWPHVTRFIFLEC